MLFMNRWEIEDAADRYAAHPVLGPATRTLRNLADAADDSSDGWAYWPKPSRAAARLQELIQLAEDASRRYGEPYDVTPEAYEPRCDP